MINDVCITHRHHDHYVLYHDNTPSFNRIIWFLSHNRHVINSSIKLERTSNISIIYLYIYMGAVTAVTANQRPPRPTYPILYSVIRGVWLGRDSRLELKQPIYRLIRFNVQQYTTFERGKSKRPK